MPRKRAALEPTKYPLEYFGFTKKPKIEQQASTDAIIEQSLESDILEAADSSVESTTEPIVKHIKEEPDEYDTETTVKYTTKTTVEHTIETRIIRTPLAKDLAVSYVSGTKGTFRDRRALKVIIQSTTLIADLVTTANIDLESACRVSSRLKKIPGKLRFSLMVIRKDGSTVYVSANDLGKTVHEFGCLAATLFVYVRERGVLADNLDQVADSVPESPTTSRGVEYQALARRRLENRDEDKPIPIFVGYHMKEVTPQGLRFQVHVYLDVNRNLRRVLANFDEHDNPAVIPARYNKIRLEDVKFLPELEAIGLPGSGAEVLKDWVINHSGTVQVKPRHATKPLVPCDSLPEDATLFVLDVKRQNILPKVHEKLVIPQDWIDIAVMDSNTGIVSMVDTKLIRPATQKALFQSPSNAAMPVKPTKKRDSAPLRAMAFRKIAEPRDPTEAYQKPKPRKQAIFPEKNDPSRFKEPAPTSNLFPISAQTADIPRYPLPKIERVVDNVIEPRLPNTPLASQSPVLVFSFTRSSGHAPIYGREGMLVRAQVACEAWLKLENCQHLPVVPLARTYCSSFKVLFEDVDDNGYYAPKLHELVALCSVAQVGTVVVLFVVGMDGLTTVNENFRWLVNRYPTLRFRLVIAVCSYCAASTTNFPVRENGIRYGDFDLQKVVATLDNSIQDNACTELITHMHNISYYKMRMGDPRVSAARRALVGNRSQFRVDPSTPLTSALNNDE